MQTIRCVFVMGCCCQVRTASGMEHFCAVTDEGRLWSWGQGGNGQLGHNDCHSRPMPTEITRMPGKGETYEEAQRWRRVVDVACGNEHTCVLLASGQFCTFGCGIFGRLGSGDETNRLTPQLVEGLCDN
jgi:alpha-tubulin suppressor-like RCC1 family protein